MIKYIADKDHYTEVLSRCEKVKHDLWIGTADLKDLYVGSGKDVVPFLSILDKLLKRGVDVRLLHAKEPGENFREVLHEYGRKYPNRGYGGRFFRWLLKKDGYEPYNSFGNGSAMRVSPCAYLAKGNRELALTWAAASAVCTHNHPEGVKGAMAITDCILLAQAHRPKSEIKELAEELYDYDMNFTIDEIRPRFGFNETCQKTVPQAIECFLESHDFESAIRIAISLGGDSDTIANITGGIAEAYYGVPEEMRKTAMAMLSEEMQQVVNKMYDDKQ